MSILDIDLGYPRFRLTDVPEKNSSSRSVVSFATLDDEDVVVKTWLYDNDNNSLEVESKIYLEIMPDMKKYTPHVLDGICVLDTVDIVSSAKERLDQLSPEDEEYTYILTMMEQLFALSKNQDFEAIRTTHSLLTPNLGKCSLYDTMGEYRNDPYRMMGLLNVVIPQVAYTLLCFEDFGLMHHDLHYDNIMLKKLSHEEMFIYNFGAQYPARVWTRFMVKIYDFDHASKRRTEYSTVEFDNTLLSKDHCDSLNECNEFQKNVDWFTFIHYIYSFQRYCGEHTKEVISDICTSIIMSELLDMDSVTNTVDNLTWTGRPCVCVESDLRSNICKKCERVKLHDYVLTDPYMYLQSYKSRLGVTNIASESHSYSRCSNNDAGCAIC